MAVDEVGIKLYKRFDQMDGNRSQWRTHWDEVQEKVCPRKDTIFRDSFVRGEKKHNRIYDTFGILSNDFLSSALHGLLTNPASIWFGLTTGDDKLDERDNVKAWLQDSTRIMINTMNASNFQTEIHEVYQDHGCFGTSVLRVVEDEIDDIRFAARPIYEFTIDENARGVIDTVFYEYEMTVRQIAEEFGVEVLSHDLMKKLEADPQWREKVLHAVIPATDLVSFLNPIGDKKFVSYKVLKATKQVLEKKGFFENPYIVSRWTKLSGEIYGRSPGMKALAELKMTDAMKKATIEAAQLAVAPPLQAPDDGVLLPIKTAPRSVNFFRAGSKDRIEPLNTGSDPRLGEEMIRLQHEIIGRHFFLDKLNVREADRMTATEIIQRRDEQLRVLGPILGRQHNELLKPLVERVFNILDRRGKIPAPPEELVNRRVEVQYTSQIAKAQRAAEADQIIKAMQIIQPFIQLNPEAMDNIDVDQVVRIAGKIYGLPHEMLRDEAETRDIRSDRAEAQRQQSELEQANVEADIANKVAGAEGI